MGVGVVELILRSKVIMCAVIVPDQIIGCNPSIGIGCKTCA